MLSLLRDYACKSNIGLTQSVQRQFAPVQPVRVTRTHRLLRQPSNGKLTITRTRVRPVHFSRVRSLLHAFCFWKSLQRNNTMFLFSRDHSSTMAHCPHANQFARSRLDRDGICCHQARQCVLLHRNAFVFRSNASVVHRRHIECSGWHWQQVQCASSRQRCTCIIIVLSLQKHCTEYRPVK